MSRRTLAQLINPWKFRREQEAARLQALRARDGDCCTRCRRPMRVDLPAGYDQAATVEPVVPGAPDESLDTLRLCHRRCNASGIDHTEEVVERMRRKNEAALFSRARQRANAA